MRKLILIFVIIFNCFGNEVTTEEMHQIELIVDKVSNSIKYGIGSMETQFNDEIIKYGEGHCGHYSWMLLRELIKKGYSGEIISIITYNHRNHAMVEITRKTDKKKILVDATTDLVYKYSVEDILKNPLLSQKRLGNSKSPTYSDISFWSSIKSVRYFPYIGFKTIHNIQNIKINNLNLFYKKPNDINASFDGLFNTYTATRNNYTKKINIIVGFKKQNRISSIVIEPYNIKTYPSKLEIICLDNHKLIYNDYIKPTRSLLVVNIVDPEKQYCKKIRLGFSKFKGQNRLLIRDIYFYGK